MKVYQSFKKVGNTIKESFKSKPSANDINTLGKARDKIAELESKLSGGKSPTMDYKQINADLLSRAEQRNLEAIAASKATIDRNAARKAVLLKELAKFPSLFSIAEPGDLEYLEKKLEFLKAEKTFKESVSNMKNAELQKTLWENANRTTTSPCFNFVKEGYNLCYDRSHGTFACAFIKVPTGQWHRLVKRQPNDTAKGSVNVVGNIKGEDLTSAEFNELLTAKLSLQNVVDAFHLKANENVKVESATSTNIF